MLHNTFEVELDYNKLGIDHKGNAATITTYIKDMYPQYQDAFKRPLVIVCPGGGYEHHSPREAEAIALKMLDMGYNALVLKYSLAPNEYPCALYEAAYAVKYAREHASEWDSDPDNIVMCGFSAGGHVAASIGTKWNSEELDSVAEQLGCNKELFAPNALLLGYSVLTSGEFAHRGSFERLLGSQYNDEMLKKVSLELCVTKDTPKTFLWHTFADGSVPTENSMLFAMALRKQGIPFGLHIFPEGGHGLGLATTETDTKEHKQIQNEVAVWPELFKNWMETMNN